MTAVLHARKMLALPPEQLKGMLGGSFTLVFDDGQMQVTSKSTLVSSYAWEYHRRYPKTPILMRHHCSSHAKDGIFGAKTHINMLNACMWSTYDAYKGDSNAPSIMALSKLAYDITNAIYNAAVLVTEADVVSLDITDFIEIMEDPDVKALLDNPKPTQVWVNECYSVITDKLKKDERYANNNLSKALRGGLVRQGQLLQCVGPRGYVTDLDSHYFKYPITRGFGQGMRSWYNMLTESRSSSKALGANKSQISGAEYFARRLQLLVGIVQRVHPGDCGSQHYMRWKVQPEKRDEAGNVTKECDLRYLQGKYYLDEKSGTLKEIKKDSTELIGKYIKFRSIVSGCNHPDPNGVCATCYGSIAESIPPGTNIGHLNAAYMTQQSSQNIISTKHFLSGASLVSRIVVRPEFRDWIQVSPDGLGYMLADNLAGRENYLIFHPDSVAGLVDLANVDDAEELAQSHVSNIRNFGIRSIGKDGVEINQLVDVTVDKRAAMLTYTALRYIKAVGWTYDDKRNYVVSLAKWDPNNTLMELPMKQYNMSDHAKAIADMIEASTAKIEATKGRLSWENALVELCDLVNSKLDVNIVILETILLGTMARSYAQDDYRIPKGGTAKEIGTAARTISGRSMSAVVAYDAMAKQLVNPKSLYGAHRPQLVMDVFLMPEHTVKDPYRYTTYYADK